MMLSTLGAAVAAAGFAMLAMAWLYTLARALRAAWHGAVADHRAWMLRNHALTLVAVLLRLCLPQALVPGIALEAAYPLIAWLCWAPNLWVMDLLCKGTGTGAVRRGRSG